MDERAKEGPLHEAYDDRNRRVVISLLDKMKADVGTLAFYKNLRELIDHCTYSEDDAKIRSELDKAYVALRKVASKV